MAVSTTQRKMHFNNRSGTLVLILALFIQSDFGDFSLSLPMDAFSIVCGVHLGRKARSKW